MTAMEEELAALAIMSPAQLRERWEQHHGVAPPVGFGPDLLARSLAYDLQEKRFGGLAASINRQIRRGMADLAPRAIAPDRPRPLRPGTRLTREWHGHTHHVEVTDSGFVYRDRYYASLTAIAKMITGARWSGPRFFGLTAQGESHG